MPDDLIRLSDDPANNRYAWRVQREEREAFPHRHVWRSNMRRRVHGTAAAAKRLINRAEKVRRRFEDALDLGLTELRFSFPDLPPAFDGYRILHLTDLHLDNIESTAALTAGLVSDLKADLCVLTGDIRDNIHAPTGPVIERLGRVISSLKVADGVIGILGNHDSAAMVEPMEELGIRMLINESMTLARDGECIHLTGLDDVHMYHTDDAAQALAATPDGFAIALVHSPEIVEQASIRHRLYLCGHTHGGVFNLPGRGPMVTGLKRKNRRLARGLWRHGEMVGYTNRGIGASLVPSRLGTQGEVGLITLHQGPPETAVVPL